MCPFFFMDCSPSCFYIVDVVYNFGFSLSSRRTHAFEGVFFGRSNAHLHGPQSYAPFPAAVDLLSGSSLSSLKRARHPGDRSKGLRREAGASYSGGYTRRFLGAANGGESQGFHLALLQKDGRVR